MSAAAFGLIGVVIGAFVTGGVAFFLEWRRERAAVRAGLRLVGEELKDMLGEVRVMLEAGAWGPPDVRQGLGTRISHEQWDRHRDVLAAHLSPDDWREIAGARDTERTLHARFEQVKADEDPTFMIFDDFDRSSLEGGVVRLQKIVKRVAILLNEPPPAEWKARKPRTRDEVIRRRRPKQAPSDR
jgi:hypothetical protein